MKLIRLYAVIAAILVAGSVPAAQAAPNRNPFTPPVVHRGYDPKSPLWKSQNQRGASRQSNSGVFDDDARRNFKAMHPFLLRESKPIPVRRPSLGRHPKARKAIKRSRKV